MCTLATMVVDDYTRFGPPTVKSNWHDLVRVMASALNVHEPSARSDVVREANHGVKTRKIRVGALARIANIRKEEGEPVGLPILPGSVSHERWLSAR